MNPNTDKSLKNPNESLQIPAWITFDFCEKILQTDLPKFSKILSFTTLAATSPGDNFTSIMVRVHMQIELTDGHNLHVSYVLKTGLDSQEHGAAMVESMSLFPKEKQMYSALLPNFERLYKDFGKDIRFGPRCVLIDETTEHITIVLEDLKPQKFVNVDRLRGFDMTHMCAVLRKLAELHAASAVYGEINGPYDQIFNKHFFTEEHRAIFLTMSDARNAAYARAVRTWGLTNAEYYIEKMPTSTEYFNEALRLNDFDPNEFNVLNHGDCWSNNIMFSYSENGEINSVRFVDFQLGKWGTPAQDLWYIITTSAALDIKIKEFDHFIYVYHKRLVECLQLLKYTKPIPSLRDIHIMMLKYGSWGTQIAFSIMVAVLYPSNSEANMDNMIKGDTEGERFHYSMYISPLYQKAMLQLYPFFEKKGLLEYRLESCNF